MIPGAIGIIANLIAAYFVQQYKRKAPVLLAVLIFPVAAAAALYTLPRADNNQELMAVYFILQIFQPLTPILFSWA
jgi:cytochrome bd-type quinol oxidase subunit 1